MNITTFCNINNRYKERMMKFVKIFILQANGRQVRDVRTLWKFDSSKRFSFSSQVSQLFKHKSNLKTRCLMPLVRNQNKKISPRPRHFLFLVTPRPSFYDLQGHSWSHANSLYRAADKLWINGLSFSRKCGAASLGKRKKISWFLLTKLIV